MKFNKTIVTGLAALTLFSITATPATTVNATTNVTEVQASAKADVITRLDDPQNVTLYVSPSLSTQVKSAIEYAKDQWNSTKLVHIKTYSGSQPEDANIDFTNQNPSQDVWGYSINKMLSTDDDNVKTLVSTYVMLDPGLRQSEYSDSAVEHTVLHEMGHALGLSDNYKDPMSIMYYTSDYSTGNPTVKLNASDYQDLKQLYYPA